MKKIKLNLVSGAKSEKPLLNAFKVNENKYVVFDNEMNGSMGLPIILVSKFQDDKLVKIVDQTEWQQAKEYLKNIIAGNKMEFIEMESEANADDIYFTQLTLPVPSFDALKNAYPFNEVEANPTLNPIQESIQNNADASLSTPVNVEPAVNPVENPVASEPVAPEVTPQESTPAVEQQPVIPDVIPVVEEQTSVVNEEPRLNPNPVEQPNLDTPVIPEVEVSTPVQESTPAFEVNQTVNPVGSEVTPNVNVETTPSNVIPNNEIDLNSPVISPDITPNVEPIVNTPETNQINENPINLDNPLLNNLNVPEMSTPTEEKEPEITPTPIINSEFETTHIEEDIFKEQKEAFMQACENMFDALVQKFEKELENRK